MDDLNYNAYNGGQNYPQSSPRRKSSKWWIPLLIIAIILGVFVFGVIAFFGFIASSFERHPVVISSNSVLYLDLKNINEYNESNPFAIFGNGVPKASFYEMIKAIEIAKSDDKILGIYCESTGNNSIDNVKSAELQEALEDFKESGKFIYSYIELADEADYYNTLPSDSIFISSEANVMLNGFGITSLFPKGLYNKIGLEYTVVQCEDYKSYGEQYTNTKFSDSARYQSKVLIQQKETEFVKAIAKHRNISEDKILNSFGKGFNRADSLLAAGLVDIIASKTDVIKFINHKINAGEEDCDNIQDIDEDVAGCSRSDNFVNINKYVASIKNTRPPKTFDNKHQIAIIYGSGTIVSSPQEMIFGRQQVLASKDFIKLLKAAKDDDNIKIIILRIDSPGGSVVASEEIYQAILQTKKVKPIYASMSDVAASGGYYIAMACDTIIAHPQTITGSIGVITAAPNFSGTIEKLGMTVDTVSTGHGKPFFLNPLLKTEEQDKAILKDYAYKTYFSFIDKAAKSRKKSFAEMRAVAKGRVWTGYDAYNKGLVDVLGGFQTAINLAKHRIGVPDSIDVCLRFLPDEGKRWEAFRKFLTNGDFVNYIQSYVAKSKYSEIEAISELLALPPSMKEQIFYNLQLNMITEKEKILIAMPNHIKIR